MVLATVLVLGHCTNPFWRVFSGNSSSSLRTENLMVGLGSHFFFFSMQKKLAKADWIRDEHMTKFGLIRFCLLGIYNWELGMLVNFHHCFSVWIWELWVGYFLSRREVGTTDLQKEDEGDLEREAETKVIWSQRDGESNFGDSYPWSLVCSSCRWVGWDVTVIFSVL